MSSYWIIHFTSDFFVVHNCLWVSLGLMSGLHLHSWAHFNKSEVKYMLTRKEQKPWVECKLKINTTNPLSVSQGGSQPSRRLPACLLAFPPLYNSSLLCTGWASQLTCNEYSNTDNDSVTWRLVHKTRYGLTHIHAEGIAFWGTPDAPLWAAS